MFEQNKYNKYWRFLKKPIVENFVFIDSFFSSNPNGEMYWLIKEIESKYDNLKIILSIKRFKDISEEIINSKSIYKFVKRESSSYYRYLATSKYLFTDMTFPFSFTKRAEQIYFNTWHGTP